MFILMILEVLMNVQRQAEIPTCCIQGLYWMTTFLQVLLSDRSVYNG